MKKDNKPLTAYIISLIILFVNRPEFIGDQFV